MHAGERRGRNHRGDHFDRVVPHDAHVGEAEFVDPLEQAAHARTVHVDGEEVDVGPRAARSRRWSRPCRSRSRARAARGAPNTRSKSSGAGANGNAERAATAVERALLRRRHAPLPQHEAADRPAMRRTRRSSVALAIIGRARSRRAVAARPSSASARRRSSVAAVVRPPACSRSRACSASFHVATASVHGSRRLPRRAPCARRRASRARSRARSRNRRSQKSAVTRRARSGESFGSAGRSILRPFVRCSSVNDASSPSVA